MVLPLNNCSVTSPYGIWRIIDGVKNFHKGIDLISTSGDIKVKAIRDGFVSYVGYDKDFGNYISIQQEDGFRALYCHLKSYNVKKGQSINEGQEIGIEGNTGNSKGIHLHLELRKNPYTPNDYVDIAEYLYIKNDEGNVIYKDNYELLEYLGILDYWRQNYKGKGITIASRESENAEHGRKVSELLRKLVPESIILIDEEYDDEINDFNIYTTSLSFSSDKLPINENKAKELFENNKFLVCAVGNHSSKRQTAISKNVYFQSIGACKLVDGIPKREIYSAITDDIDFMCLTDFKLSDGIFNGTSCATPIFSSMCVLIQNLALNKMKRNLTNTELLDLIKDNLIDLEEEGRDARTGHGLFILPKPWNIDFSKYSEEDDNMPIIRNLIDIYGNEAVEKSFKRLVEAVNDDGMAADWAKEELQEAVDAGITDGNRPEMFTTRQETAIMIKRAMK